MATSQYGAFVCECVLKLFDPESTEPIMNMLCDVGRNNTTTTSNDNNNLNNNNNNITAPTNLCKVAMTQYGTQFLQKFVDIADESQLSMLDTILSDDLVDIMMCSSYSGHFLMKMLKSRGNKILLSSCRGVQMLARDIANLSSNDRSSHVSAKHTFTFCLEWGIDSLFFFFPFPWQVLQMLLEDSSIWYRLEASTRTLMATAVALNLSMMIGHRLSLHVVCKLYKIVLSEVTDTLPPNDAFAIDAEHKSTAPAAPAAPVAPAVSVAEAVLLKSLDSNFLEVMRATNGHRLGKLCGCALYKESFDGATGPSHWTESLDRVTLSHWTALDCTGPHC